MDPKNSGQDCILCRDLKVLLRQGFKSLLQVFVATCSSLSRPAPDELKSHLFLVHFSVLFSVKIE